MTVTTTLRGLSMGRGRQKAKQAKVARALKYDTTGTDLEALQAELAAERARNGESDSSIPDGDYSDWIDDDDESEDDEGEEEAK